MVVNPDPNGQLSVQVEPVREAIYGTSASATAVVSVTDSSDTITAGDKVEIDAGQNSTVAGSCTATRSPAT